MLTLILLTGFLLIFAAVQFRISPTNFIVAPALNHITSVAGDVAQDLAETPAGSRSELLSRLSKEYGVEFYLVDVDGQQPDRKSPSICRRQSGLKSARRFNSCGKTQPEGRADPGRVGPAGLVIGPWRVDAIFRKKTDNPVTVLGRRADSGSQRRQPRSLLPGFSC